MKKCIFFRSFNCLNDTEGAVYLQLDNWSAEEKRDMKAEYAAKNSTLTPEAPESHVKMVKIYIGNWDKNGCSFKTSRFKHSCHSTEESKADGIQVCLLILKIILFIILLMLFLLLPWPWWYCCHAVTSIIDCAIWWKINRRKQLSTKQKGIWVQIAI